MNSNFTALLKSDMTRATRNVPTWQAEVADLYRNHFLIELILCRSTQLSADSVCQCRTMQQLMIQTIEQFLKEMDELEAGNTLHQSRARKVLLKHASVMRQLNQLVHDLMDDQPFTVQA